MKKLSFFPIAILLLFVGQSTFAQEGENNLKNFRFGLFGEPCITWYRPDNTEHLVSKGSGVKFAYGLVMDFRLNKTTFLSMGIKSQSSGGHLGITSDEINNNTVARDTVIYWNEDNKDVPDSIMLLSRDYQVSYVTIPLTLKMKTQDINGFTFFGQFGADLSVKTKAKSLTDQGKIWKYPYTSLTVVDPPIKKIDITKEMNFMNIGLNIGAGLEYNLSGTTSILFSVNYHRGFTNVFNGSCDELQQRSWDSANSWFSYDKYKPNAKADYVSFTVGVLF